MIKQQSIENYQSYSKFHSLKDFNNNMEAFLFDHKESFTASEIIAFKRLTKFAAKVYGVATASVKTILRAIKDKTNGIGISESTFHRMRRKAMKLGILSVIHTERKNGSQSSNLWVFNRYLNKDVSSCLSNDTPSDNADIGQSVDHTGIDSFKTETQLTAHKTSKLFKTNNNINKRYERNGKLSTIDHLKNTSLDASFTSSRVPKEFTQLASKFYHSASVIEELWKIVQCQAHHTLYGSSTVLTIACEGFKQLIRHVKFGTVRKTIYSLYWGILDKKFDELFFEDLYESGFPV